MDGMSGRLKAVEERWEEDNAAGAYAGDMLDEVHESEIDLIDSII